MQIGLFSLHILSGGRPVREYGYDGRTFVAGGPGQDYTIRLNSRAGRRVKAVLSVDGLNVIDGKPAGMGGPGYILEPWSAMDVPGWRLNDESVARFVFGAPEQSYAAAAGKAENVGVIGAAFFSEVTPPPAVSGDEEKTCGSASPSPTVFAKGVRGPSLTRGVPVALYGGAGASGGSLGTGFGARTDHTVRRVEFSSQPLPAATLEVRYEDAAILRGLGVNVEDDMPALHTPNAFPAEGYCSPPRGWRG